MKRGLPLCFVRVTELSDELCLVLVVTGYISSLHTLRKGKEMIVNQEEKHTKTKTSPPVWGDMLTRVGKSPHQGGEIYPPTWGGNYR